MRFASIREMDISNGTGIGVSLFVQGCPAPHCEGCFNPETWSFVGGSEWTTDIENAFFKMIDKSYIKRVSFLGGECLCDDNVQEVTRLAKKCKKLFPSKEIWLWTRFDFKTQVAPLEITHYLDYVVDGHFELAKKDLRLKFRGSSNQNIWHKEHNTWGVWNNNTN